MFGVLRRHGVNGSCSCLPSVAGGSAAAAFFSMFWCAARCAVVHRASTVGGVGAVVDSGGMVEEVREVHNLRGSMSSLFSGLAFHGETQMININENE